MHVVRHDDESTADPISFFEFFGKNRDHDLSAVRMIQQAPTMVAGERHELGMKLFIIDSSCGHGGIITAHKGGYNPVVADQIPGSSDDCPRLIFHPC